jgi:hypothetical protein
MKIHQLANGERFEYEGEEYVKTGPLFATGKGGQRLIPKYAVLKPLGETQASAPENKEVRVAKAAVLGAFDAFCEECSALVAEDRQSEMEACRRRFLNAIDGEM